MKYYFFFQKVKMIFMRFYMNQIQIKYNFQNIDKEKMQIDLNYQNQAYIILKYALIIIWVEKVMTHLYYINLEE